MKKNNLKSVITYAIFYGSLWGITEATLGHFLHSLPVLISGSVMFPIAIFLMLKAFDESKSSLMVILMGVTAATIKFIDIILPNLPAIKTLNPMIAILLQASIVAIFMPLLSSRKVLNIIIGSIGASLIWRSLFIIESYFLDNYTHHAIPWVNYSDKVYSFIVTSGLVSALITLVIIFVRNLGKFKIPMQKITNPAFGVGLFISALLLQYIW